MGMSYIPLTWGQSMLKDRYLALEHLLDGKSIYIRIATLVVTILVLYFLWSAIVRPWLETDAQTWNSKIENVKTQIKTFDSQITDIQKQVKAGHGATEQGKLEAQLQTHQENLAIFENQLIPLKKMDDVIHSMLNKDGLKLIKLNMDDLKPFVTDNQSASQTQLYEETLNITFSGNFFDTIKYLKTMEASNWHFFWNTLDYQVEAYPNAQIELAVQALVKKRGGKT